MKLDELLDAKEKPGALLELLIRETNLTIWLLYTRPWGWEDTLLLTALSDREVKE